MMTVESEEMMPDSEIKEECNHEPDWNSVQVNHEEVETYIDINCIFCGMSGCVGNERTLTNDINWE